jgi:phenylacetic acid degradation protein PaaD
MRCHGPMEVALAMAEHEGTSRAWKHRIEDVSLESAVVSMEVLPEMVNGLGVIHGGMAFALADTALAYLACAGNELHVTATAAVNFLAPANLGELLTARAKIVAREGRSTAIDVVVTGDGGRTIATCHGISRKLGGSVIDALRRT